MTEYTPIDSVLPKATRLGIDTRHEAVIFLRSDSPIAKAEGFEPLSQVEVSANQKKIIAKLLFVTSDLLSSDAAGLSESAWKKLQLKEGQHLKLSHPDPVNSISYVRSKVFGHELNEQQYFQIIQDIVKGYYSDLHIAAFITACANNNLSQDEIIDLTNAMIANGHTISWEQDVILDKHCIGGLPGNRTTPIVVAIIAALGFKIPKTSSRAITSPAGTADVMEVMTSVQLSHSSLKDIVSKEGGCLAWGGSVGLSPADDILITIERALDIDFEGQLIASILSKKISAGSNTILIDIPVGKTAKVRSASKAHQLAEQLTVIGEKLGVKVTPIITDGSQPIGHGIGPALEAHDVLAVLRNSENAPQDLKHKALLLASTLLQKVKNYTHEEALNEAEYALQSGQALEKFMQICKAQGGFKEPEYAHCRYSITAESSGELVGIDNRQLAKLAKLSGAPADKCAGIYLYKKLGDRIEKDDLLMEIHADSPGELDYALQYYCRNKTMIKIKES